MPRLDNRAEHFIKFFCLRAYSESPCTPPWPVLFRPAALQKLVSHTGWTAFLCLAGQKNPGHFGALGDPEYALRFQAQMSGLRLVRPKAAVGRARGASPLEAPPGFEPGVKVLQTSALPLGYGAKKWSGLRGSNSLPPPWQGGALPDELNPQMATRMGLEPTTSSVTG